MKPHPRHLAQAVCIVLGLDRERVFEPCRRATGSITEACVMLLRNMPVLGASGARATRPDNRPDTRPDDDIPPRVAEIVTMLREGWRPGSGRAAGGVSGRAAHAHDEKEGARDAPIRLILLYISPPSYTLGIRGSDGAFIPIGKVDSMSDIPADERAKLHKRAKALITESFGPTSLLTPEIVVEASYSQVEANPRTKAKKVLRDVRLTRVCWGEPIESIATLESLTSSS